MDPQGPGNAATPGRAILAAQGRPGHYNRYAPCAIVTQTQTTFMQLCTLITDAVARSPRRQAVLFLDGQASLMDPASIMHWLFADASVRAPGGQLSRHCQCKAQGHAVCALGVCFVLATCFILRARPGRGGPLQWRVTGAILCSSS
jgi:hypothetical protein